MTQYLIIYEILDYPENGGGMRYEVFETPELMDRKVQNMADRPDFKFDILLTARLGEQYEYAPVEIVKKFERRKIITTI